MYHLLHIIGMNECNECNECNQSTKMIQMSFFQDRFEYPHFITMLAGNRSLQRFPKRTCGSVGRDMNKWKMWKQSRNRLNMNSKYQWFFLVPTYHIWGSRRTTSNEKYESNNAPERLLHSSQPSRLFFILLGSSSIATSDFCAHNFRES